MWLPRSLPATPSSGEMRQHRQHTVSGDGGPERVMAVNCVTSAKIFANDVLHVMLMIWSNPFIIHHFRTTTCWPLVRHQSSGDLFRFGIDNRVMYAIIGCTPQTKQWSIESLRHWHRLAKVKRRNDGREQCECGEKKNTNSWPTHEAEQIFSNYTKFRSVECGWMFCRWMFGAMDLFGSEWVEKKEELTIVGTVWVPLPANRPANKTKTIHALERWTSGVRCTAAYRIRIVILLCSLCASFTLLFAQKHVDCGSVFIVLSCCEQQQRYLLFHLRRQWQYERPTIDQCYTSLTSTSNSSRHIPALRSVRSQLKRRAIIVDGRFL